MNTSARRASNDIADLEKRIAAFLREESKVTSSVVGFLQDASNTLGSLSLVAPLPEFPMPSTTSTMEHPDRPYRIEAINAYREHLTSWFENQSSNLANASSHISQAIERIRPDVESLHKSFQENADAFMSAERERVEGHYRQLEADVAKLRRFHDRIYLSDRLWFRLYHVSPVFGLFLLATWMFVRPYLPL